MQKLLSDEETQLLKNVELQILVEVDRICKKNNIKYSLAFGTLIGAVRHKGFIPWDDDIDIMMERSEYDTFCSRVEEELGKNFYFVSFENCKDYALPFSKVMARNTVFQEVSSSSSNAPNGVWIDIFPIDITTSNTKKRAEQYSTAQLIKKKLFCKANYSFGKRGLSLVVYRLKKLLYLHETHEMLVDKYHQNAVKYSDRRVDNKLICLGGNSGVEKGTYEKTWFDSYIEMTFEDKTFMCIEKYDYFLRHIYGDYMLMPPINERKPHHYVKKFSVSGEWKTIYEAADKH